MILGIWSGPHALWGLMVLSNLHTPAVLMLISLIIGLCGGSRCGGADSPYLVKTLWNWSRRISAFSLLSHTSEPVFFGGGGGGATTMLSCFLLLMYFQKGFELFVWRPWVMVLLIYSHSALRITSSTCLLDEFVVYTVVCFLSILIVFSFALVVDAASRLTMGGCIGWSSVLMGYVCQ